MTTITRRQAISALASISATAGATAALALPAISQPADASPVLATPAEAENPELLRLGGMLPGIEAQYQAATAARSAIIKKWSTRWPSAPAELHEHNAHEVERDLTGHGVTELTKYGEDRCRHILTVEDLEWMTKRARSILKGRGIDKRNCMGMNRAEWEAHLDETVEQHRIASAYEAEKARILKMSRYEAADERMHAARKTLGSLVEAVMSQPETTMAGVMVKAQAMAAWGKVPPFWAMLEAHKWGPSLAASIMRVAGETVQS